MTDNIPLDSMTTTAINDLSSLFSSLSKIHKNYITLYSMTSFSTTITASTIPSNDRTDVLISNNTKISPNSKDTTIPTLTTPTPSYVMCSDRDYSFMIMFSISLVVILILLMCLLKLVKNRS